MSDTRYDPFEDTGDWPFRDAPPRPDPVEKPTGEPLFSELGDTAVGAPPSFEEPEDSVPDEVASEDVPFEPVAAAVAEAVEPVVVEDSPPAAPPIEPAAEPAVEAEVPESEEMVEDVLPEEALVPEEEEPADLPQHAPGAFVVPPGPEVLEGGPNGFRRTVAVVVSRFNGDITSRMLETTLAELRDCHVGDDAITVVPVPGAFELPLAALALAKTRRFACVVALGCVIRGDTAHFDLVAGEAASGLQLAAIETGIPVSFGVLTCDTREQAEARIDRAAEAARTALEMADLFSHVRTRAAGA
jgi:6,7-dimethyl-8-ribityllumazine synthase